MSVGVRRSDLEIIRDVLRIEQGGITHVRFRANLSYVQIQKYLAFMEQLELVELERRDTQVIKFQVTDKGRKILHLLQILFATMAPPHPSASEGQNGQV